MTKKILLMALVVIISGCGKETDVTERAKNRWNYLLSGETDKAYEYLSPGTRSKISEDGYRLGLLQKKVRWVAAEHIETNCLEDSCKLLFSLKYKINQPVPGVPEYEGQQKITEDWVKSGGRWWYVPQE